MRATYFYGYNIVAAGFAIQAVSIGALFAYGVFFKELQAEFGWSRTTISGASSLAFFVMGAVGVLAGRLNDRIGPKILITLSGTSLGIGYLLLSYMQASWQLYLLYGLLVGVGYSTHDVITLSTIARWFVKRRGMMSGIVKVGTGCGQLCVPLIATALIAAFGWRYACFIILICGLVWLQLSSVTWMLFLFATIYGFAHGGLFTVMSPTVAELFGTGSHGLLFGIVLFSGTLGGAIGPLMAGRIFDLNGSYRLVFIILTAMALIGFILITTLRPPAKDVAGT